MCLLPEKVPLPSSPEASAVRGRQRAIPSDPLVRRRMAEKLAARRKSLPYGGVAKRQRRSCTASLTPELRSDDDEVVQPLRLLSCLLETNAIRRPEPLSIAEAMERLLIPAVRVRGESSPSLAETAAAAQSL